MVEVKYQGHISQKMAGGREVGDISVSQTHLVLLAKLEAMCKGHRSTFNGETCYGFRFEVSR